MSIIEIVNEHSYPVDAELLRQAAVVVLQAHDALDSDMAIVLTHNETVQELNRQYRGVDAPTDVLSFPADPLPPELVEDAPWLGDLMIAFPYASEQATRLGHPQPDSFALLVVHGALHLLGYDHDTPENRAEMWAAQAEALRELNIDTGIVPALEEAPHDEASD